MRRTRVTVEKTKCYGCGALVDHIEGVPHKYIGATQGCWDLYVQILAKEYGEYNYPELTHRLTVDTYAIQHPGMLGRQSKKSVNVHLASLYLVLVKNVGGKEATQKIGKLLAKKPEFEWLEPPFPNGQKTVLDVLPASNLGEHEQKVRAWAVNVWSCWNSKHRNAIEKIVIEHL
ncbi:MULTISPECIES: DUF5946 family protein [Flavobacteriaceae]|uniref:DUF5946 family protein n=1 Tax=Flavobacteriaceae TaxID=49546 RepID=UPI00234A3474|nr:DUF5946 family protein [Muricauda sp. SP22]MDC6363631.1 DUF5946 family protein [Muricauda sp. SP22]